jgi:hypothetical protein
MPCEVPFLSLMMRFGYFGAEEAAAAPRGTRKGRRINLLDAELQLEKRD